MGPAGTTADPRRGKEGEGGHLHPHLIRDKQSWIKGFLGSSPGNRQSDQREALAYERIKKEANDKLRQDEPGRQCFVGYCDKALVEMKFMFYVLKVVR